jgi:hypothetical protein
MKLIKDGQVKILDDNSALIEILKVQGWAEEGQEIQEKPEEKPKKKAKK